MACTANTQKETLHSGKPFRHTGRQNLSSPSSSLHSCNSSVESLSFNEDFYPFSPITPLRFSSGIPFSWEKIPGIPKQESVKNKESLKNLLPLPPARKTSNSSKKYVHDQIFLKKKDPFFAAFVECSKEDDDHYAFGSLWKGSKITRALNSCKRSCEVSDSLVYIPIPRSDYLLNCRSK